MAETMKIDLPRWLYHPVMEALIVKTLPELTEKLAQGYSVLRSVRADADALREAIIRMEAELKAARARLADIEKESMKYQWAPVMVADCEEPSKAVAVDAVETADVVEAEINPLQCPLCSKVAASAAGLQAHMRSHK